MVKKRRVKKLTDTALFGKAIKVYHGDLVAPVSKRDRKMSVKKKQTKRIVTF